MASNSTATTPPPPPNEDTMNELFGDDMSYEEMNEAIFGASEQDSASEYPDPDEEIISPEEMNKRIREYYERLDAKSPRDNTPAMPSNGTTKSSPRSTKRRRENAGEDELPKKKTKSTPSGSREPQGKLTFSRLWQWIDFWKHVVQACVWDVWIFPMGHVRCWDAKAKPKPPMPEPEPEPEPEPPNVPSKPSPTALAGIQLAGAIAMWWSDLWKALNDKPNMQRVPMPPQTPWVKSRCHSKENHGEAFCDCNLREAIRRHINVSDYKDFQRKIQPDRWGTIKDEKVKAEMMKFASKMFQIVGKMQENK